MTSVRPPSVLGFESSLGARNPSTKHGTQSFLRCFCGLVRPVRVEADVCRYMEMCVRGFSLEDMAAEISQITGKDLMRVKRWFYRKISQTRRSGSAPPKRNKASSDKKLYKPPLSCKEPADPHLATGSGWSMFNSGDHNEEGRSDPARSRKATPLDDSFGLLTPSNHRLRAHGTEGCEAPQSSINPAAAAQVCMSFCSCAHSTYP